MLSPQDASGPVALAMLGTWAKPPDQVAWAALAVAAALILFALTPSGPRALGAFLDLSSMDDVARRRRFLTVAGFAAAFLSLGYVAIYLRGGPRLAEATTYFLQGRAASHGHFAWTISDPTASFRGQGLLFRAPDVIGGVNPPGYPLLLAFGFVFGAPMVVGPLLAASIAAATYFLARELSGVDGFDKRGRSTIESEGVARLAVGLSLVSAAMRYHTADTLAHAAAALAIATALAAALHARRTGEVASFAIAGLAAGGVVATRPLSAIPIAVVVLVLALHAPRRRRALVVAAIAAVPGVALLLASHAVVAGSPFASPAAVYCAVSDDPPGCLARGFDAVSALAAAVRHLRAHLVDVANFEPLALLVLVPVVRRSTSAVRLALVVIAGLLLVYIPFRIPASRALDAAPGRTFADALAVEHAVLAYGVAQLVPSLAFARRALVVLALACAGFAVHAVFAHHDIATRDGDRPKYEPDVTREANVSHGLLYFDTVEGFNLAHDPDAQASHALLAVRYRGDDHDRLVYDMLGHPAVHRYLTAQPPEPSPLPSSSAFGASSAVPVTSATPASAPFWIPPPPSGGYTDETWRFEAESDWPALSQAGGTARPVDLAGTCASDGHALALTPTGGAAEAIATIELPLPKADLANPRWSILPRVFRNGTKAQGKLEAIDESGLVLATWTWSDELVAVPPQGTEACFELPPQVIEMPVAAINTGNSANGLVAFARLRLTAQGGAVTFDRTHVKRPPP